MSIASETSELARIWSDRDDDRAEVIERLKAMSPLMAAAVASELTDIFGADTMFRDVDFRCVLTAQAEIAEDVQEVKS